MSDGAEPDGAEPASDVPERRGETLIAALLVISICCGTGLGIVYVAGGQPQLEGVLLATGLGCVGVALVLWAHRLLPSDERTQQRPTYDSDVVTTDDSSGNGDAHGQVERRPLLRWLLGGSLATFGAAALFPIRSLGPSPGNALRQTAWRRGVRVVDESGNVVLADEVPFDSLTTVFPEGHVGSADGVAVLIRVPDRLLSQPPDREIWTPGGLIAYSKLCTHAGCPVGLYQAESKTLLCPCHQSLFDVLEGGEAIQGPAARPLPQLPLGIREGGELIARGDFSAPVGATWWDMP